MGSSTNCPKCGAAIERTGVSVVSELPIAIYTCGTRQLDTKDSAPLQSDKCRITALQQQLADARLLARAAAELLADLAFDRNFVVHVHESYQERITNLFKEHKDALRPQDV